MVWALILLVETWKNPQIDKSNAIAPFYDSLYWSFGSALDPGESDDWSRHFLACAAAAGFVCSFPLFSFLFDFQSCDGRATCIRKFDLSQDLFCFVSTQKNLLVSFLFFLVFQQFFTRTLPNCPQPPNRLIPRFLRPACPDRGGDEQPLPAIVGNLGGGEFVLGSRKFRMGAKVPESARAARQV